MSRKDHNHVTFAVTGIFPTDACMAEQPRLICFVEQGWHGVSKGMQWRPITKDLVFTANAADGNGLSTTYTCELPLPGSMLIHEYRILVEELEWYRRTTEDTDKNFYQRRIYMHYVDLYRGERDIHFWSGPNRARGRRAPWPVRRRMPDRKKSAR